MNKEIENSSALTEGIVCAADLSADHYAQNQTQPSGYLAEYADLFDWARKAFRTDSDPNTTINGCPNLPHFHDEFKTQHAQTVMPDCSATENQVRTVQPKEDDDSEPIYLDFNFAAAQQNNVVNIQSQQQFPIYNNNTMTNGLVFNTVCGNISSQNIAMPRMHKPGPKKRGRPLVNKEEVHEIAKNEIISESLVPIETPPSQPIVFETVIVCAPRRTKLTARQNDFAQVKSVLTPAQIVSDAAIKCPKTCRKQTLHLRAHDEYEFICQITNIIVSESPANSPVRSNNYDGSDTQELTLTPVRPSKRLFDQRRRDAAANVMAKSKTERTKLLFENDSDSEIQMVTGSGQSLKCLHCRKYFKTPKSMVIHQRSCEKDDSNQMNSKKRKLFTDGASLDLEERRSQDNQDEVSPKKKSRKIKQRKSTKPHSKSK